MLARSELLSLAFFVSGLMIVAALLLLRIGARQGARLEHGVGGRPEPRQSPPRLERGETLQLFSGATMAALEELTRSKKPARRRERMICDRQSPTVADGRRRRQPAVTS
jgi:hypothetical protein